MKWALLLVLLLVGVARIAAPTHAHPPTDTDTDTDTDSAAPDDTNRTVVTPTRHSNERTIGGTVLDMTPRRDAGDLLRLVPGLVLVQHGNEGKGQQIFVRGFDAAHGADFEVQVDGLRMNELSNVHANGYLDLGLLIPDLVTSIDVTKGSFSLDQGLFGTGGTARYRLGVPTDERGARLTWEVGSTGRFRTTAGWSPAVGDDFLIFEAMQDEGFGPDRLVARQAGAARVNLLELFDSHDDTDRVDRLDLTVLAAQTSFETPTLLRLGDLDRLDPSTSYIGDLGGQSRRALAVLRWRREGATRLDVRLSGQARTLDLIENFTGSLDDIRGDRRDQHHGAWSVGLDGDLTHGDGPLVLSSSLGLTFERFDQTEDRIDAAHRPFARPRSLVASQLTAHAVAGLAWRPLHWLRMTAGARLEALLVDLDDLTNAEPLAAVLPRVRLDASTGRFVTTVAYGRGLRPPEARAFAAEPETIPGTIRYTGGEPRLTISDSLEAGVSWRSDLIAVELAAFATFVARESVFDHVSASNIELGATRRLGLELAVEVAPIDALLIRTDLSLVDARFEASGNPVPGAPTAMGSLEITLRHGPFRAGLRGWFIGPRPLAFGARSAAIPRLDLTADLRWSRFLIGLTVENTLDLTLQEGSYHYASRWLDEEPSQLPRVHLALGPPLNARLRFEVRW